ncbi:uncharacterized protein B0P05DRAFT_555663 [Gilbertella persicaria]|uniref:uncharacterized protein n=1 Tax=Gilbertella persicaria TaxID=101096 RepID=UPI0022206A7D|nr:uncharacterized protein B0P05DRAFT_555663 [Gilbertella persicaria]KAI8063376.1 hypothetical protein B0P05DRAFT_555663 [Gilbertella persicaria]
MTSWSNTIPHGCMAILTAHPNALTDKSTQTYEFAFWDMKHTDNKLPLEITNMKESTTGYKNFMSNAPYQTTASSSNKRLTTMSPSQIIIQQFDNMYQESFQALQTSIQSVMDKEAEIEKLKQEIELHKSEIKK